MLFGKKKLLAAIVARDVNCLSLLLRRRPSLANAVVSFSWLGKRQRPLHLIARGMNMDGNTASQGVEFQHDQDDIDLAMGLLLIKSGAKVHCLDENGETPLHYACSRGHQRLVELFLNNGASTYYRNAFNMPVLSYALQYRRDDLATFLIKQGVELNYSTGHRPGDPVSVACKYGCLHALRSMVAIGAGIDEPDSFGDVPLHWAAENGHIEIVRELILLGADIDAANEYGLTSLHLSAVFGYGEVMQLLLISGADVNAITHKGQTPLHVAVQNGAICAAQILLDNGAQANATDKSGVTPLHLAAEKGRSDLISLLIKAGAEVNAKTQKGKPL